jgi:hypothetical protein
VKGHTKLHEDGSEGDIPYFVMYREDETSEISWYRATPDRSEWTGPLFGGAGFYLRETRV